MSGLVLFGVVSLVPASVIVWEERTSLK